MFTMHHLIGVGVAALAVGLPMAPAAAQATTDTRPHHAATGHGCRMARLPVPAGATDSAVYAGDRTGRYLVGSATIPSEGQPKQVALVWVGGRYRPFDTSALGPSASVHDVNTGGVIVGDGASGPGAATLGWIYRRGQFSLLPGLIPSDMTLVRGINSRGDVVGARVDRSTGATQAVIWPASAPGTVRALAVDGAWSSFGLDIADDGTAITHVQFYGSRTASYVWPVSGTAFPLHAPAGGDDNLVFARAIRDTWIVGEAAGGAARWDLRTGTAQLISTTYFSASAVNRVGTVAVIGAIIHRDGRVVRLGDSALPYVLTDRGIAAGVRSGHAVIWTGC